MKLLKDYDCVISYLPGKANMVPYALSRKSFRSLADIAVSRRSMVIELHELIDAQTRILISKLWLRQ